MGSEVVRAVRISISVVSLLVVIGVTAALVSRIKELRGGQERDIGNTDFISGKEIETLGIVKGSVIQSKHLGKDIMAGFKTIVGGELTGYSEMIQEARSIATQRMVEEAEALGADGVINMRYALAAVMQGAAEMLVHGTAVKFA